MMKKSVPAWRGLTVQLFAITVLPLSLLLLLIALGSISLHERDMRALVAERDARAIRSAAAALEAELHHRAATIDLLARSATEAPDNADMAADFDGGFAYFAADGTLDKSTGQTALWNWVAENLAALALASPADPGPVFSRLVRDPGSGRGFVIVSAYSSARPGIVAGAFSPQSLARGTLPPLYPSEDRVTIYLLDPLRNVLYSNGVSAPGSLSADQPGVSAALRGESGAVYARQGDAEHVVTYSPVPTAGWALITTEAWQSVVSPSLQITQMAPLVLVPVFILALLALWFGARQIVQPLQKLESQAAALAWGDFRAIQEPVGGISEVQHLQEELAEMSRKVQAAQEGLRDYIGAITSAQEDERLRLAHELHDDTIQSVIALKQRLQLAQRSAKDAPALEALHELEAMAEGVIENLRRMTRALRPIYLEDLGLVTALEMLARETSQADSLEVDFRKVGDEQRLSPEVELALYRIAQEALNNVLRHADARHAQLQITFDDREVALEVSDDGIGFEVPRSPTDFAPNGHFGLLGIRERAELIGARLEVDSAPGKGTHLRVRADLGTAGGGADRPEPSP